MPDVPQVAHFDTAFTTSQRRPDVQLPRALSAEGTAASGFHVLS